MKFRHFAACAVAVIALAGCKKKAGTEAGNETVNFTQVTPPPGGDWTQSSTRRRRAAS